MSGEVVVGDHRETKPGSQVRDDVVVRLKNPPKRFVSRAGGKLDGALNDLGIDVSGRRVLDVGASTGGFTDCVLQRGAAEVVALDVGYGLLDAKVRNDPRVIPLERCNARKLTAGQLPWPPDLITIDVSFIAIRALLDALSAVASQQAWMLAMVKPQFELPRNRVPKGGVVRDDDARRHAAELVTDAASSNGWLLRDQRDSKVAGPKGNREIFVWLQRDNRGADPHQQRGPT